MKSTIMRIAWKAFIYCVWRERNNKVHNNTSETAVQVFERIKEVIRIKVEDLKGTDNEINRQLRANWGI